MISLVVLSAEDDGDDAGLFVVGCFLRFFFVAFLFAFAGGAVVPSGVLAADPVCCGCCLC